MSEFYRKGSNPPPPNIERPSPPPNPPAAVLGFPITVSGDIPDDVILFVHNAKIVGVIKK